MWKRTDRLSWSGVLVLCGLLLNLSLSDAQEENEPGHSIGEVSTQGDLIAVELDDGALGKTNLFDLIGHTLRFTPDGSRYRVESGPLQWVADFGPEVANAEVTLHQFAFPFSGKRWNSFLVGTTGSIKFGTRARATITLLPTTSPRRFRVYGLEKRRWMAFTPQPTNKSGCSPPRRRLPTRLLRRECRCRSRLPLPFPIRLC